MSQTRRSFLRSGAVVAGATALGGGLLPARTARAAPALARPAGTTLESTLLRGTPTAGGYAPVVPGPGDPLLVRTDLGVGAGAGRATRRRAMLAFAQLSDVHVVDVQSPLRLEFLDRYDDAELQTGLVSSAYRPQEMLTAQTADAMVRAVNDVGVGPVTGAPLALALQTGDNSDNGQLNEIRWNIDTLDGGRVRPDSGDLSRFEGVADDNPWYYDQHYWHPGAPPLLRQEDFPASRYGFPRVEGLLDAARRPFDAGGLTMDWYTAFGNHDGLVQGNFPRTLQLTLLAEGSAKIVSPPTGLSVADLLRSVRGDLAALVRSLTLTPYVRFVTPDPERRILSRGEVVEQHFRTTGTPVGHGFTARNRAEDTAYYTIDRGPVRFVVLDTVNPNGEAGGSIDASQFAWLRYVLQESSDRVVILASHHTVDTMNNPLIATGLSVEPRVLGDRVRDELLRHPQVVAWVNGHTHRNQVWAHRRGDGKPGGFWEINTAAHIDWPQQARLLEVADNADGTLSIFATLLDHAGPAAYGGRTGASVPLAGLGRELAMNDWQERESERRGADGDRNVELLVARPPGVPQ